VLTPGSVSERKKTPMLLNEPSPYDLRDAPMPDLEANEKNRTTVSAPSDADLYLPRQIQQSPPPVSRHPDQWSDIDLRLPLPPEPVDGVLDLLAPILDMPLLVVDQPPLPPLSELAALHRAEVEAEFAEPPVTGLGDEPPIPARFAPGLAVLPHIDFPA
jgi:hypothetical protein